MIHKRLTQILFLTWIALISVQIHADGMLEEDMPMTADGMPDSDESVIELDLDSQKIYADPFKRGITRSPVYATFGEESDNEARRIDDMRHLLDLRYYRVVSLVEDNETDMPKILELNPDDFFGDEHQGYYVKIDTHNDPSKIQTIAKNLMVNYKKDLNRYLIIRFNDNQTQDNYSLEYGPFRTKEITAAHCHYLVALVKNENLSCDKILFHFVSDQEIMAQQNTAIIGLSQFALLDIKDKPYEFSLEKLRKMTLEITVDEMLGPHGFHVTNINEKGISVTGLSGNAMFIPVSTFPINIDGSTTPTPSSANPVN